MLEELIGKLVILKSLQESFFELYLEMFSELVMAFLHVSMKKSEEEYLCDRLDKHIKNQTLFYCIFNKKENKLIGVIEIRDAQEFEGQLYS